MRFLPLQIQKMIQWAILARHVGKWWRYMAFTQWTTDGLTGNVNETNMYCTSKLIHLEEYEATAYDMAFQMLSKSFRRIPCLDFGISAPARQKCRFRSGLPSVHSVCSLICIGLKVIGFFARKYQWHIESWTSSDAVGGGAVGITNRGPQFGSGLHQPSLPSLRGCWIGPKLIQEGKTLNCWSAGDRTPLRRPNLNSNCLHDTTDDSRHDRFSVTSSVGFDDRKSTILLSNMKDFL